MDTKFFDSSVYSLTSDQWRALMPYLWLCAGLAVSVVYAGYRASRCVGRVLAAVIFGGFAFLQASDLGAAAQSVFGTSLEVDPLTRIVGAAVAIFALISSMFGSSSDANEDHAEWLPVLVTSVLGLSLLPGARDLLAFFVYLETLAIAGYIMVSMDTARTKSLEAGLKYLLMGAFGSALFLMGTTLLYGASGSFDFEKIALAIKTLNPADSGFAVAGGILICASLMFKVALVPFHMWSPDVYQASPSAVGAFLASATKVSIFASTAVLLSRSGILGIQGVSGFIYALAVLSIVIGSFLAVAQTHIRRLFAYSGVVNAGYAALALCAGPKAVGSMVTNLVIYGGTLMAIFAATEVFARNLGKSNNSDIEVRELARAAQKSHPMMVALFAFAIFSIAGIPPLPGFFGKYLILKDLWMAGMQNGVYVMLIGTMLGLAYYLRLFVPLYMNTESEEKAPQVPLAGWGGTASMAAFLAIVVSVLVMGGLNRLPAWIHAVEAFVR